MTDAEGLQDIKQYFPNGVPTATKNHSVVIMKVIFLHLVPARLESPKRWEFLLQLKHSVSLLWDVYQWFALWVTNVYKPLTITLGNIEYNTPCCLGWLESFTSLKPFLHLCNTNESWGNWPGSWAEMKPLGLLSLFLQDMGPSETCAETRGQNWWLCSTAPSEAHIDGIWGLWLVFPWWK